VATEQVVCRVRPPCQREKEMALGLRKCVAVADRTTVQMISGNEPLRFTFDHALPEDGTQEEVFALVGKPITDRCLEGYNGTILTYGQVRAARR
jgi:kinesin family protein 15